MSACRRFRKLGKLCSGKEVEMNGLLMQVAVAICSHVEVRPTIEEGFITQTSRDGEEILTPFGMT
jgi:hypothetical protein